MAQNSSQAQLAKYADDLAVARYARDGWLWFGEQVKTFDEHDKTDPVKPFPVEKEYLWTSYALWLEEDWTIWEKTRQLMYSWLFSGAHLHLAQFTPHRKVMLASKSEDDALALLDRITFIYDNQGEVEKGKVREPGDSAVKRSFPARRVGNSLVFDHGSQIIAIPKGKHKVRSYVCSALFADEFGFMEDGEELFGAAVPALTGGGRFTGVSSANPGHMEDMVKKAKKYAGRHQKLMEGLDVWRAKQGTRQSVEDAEGIAAGFTVVRAHYSADPDQYLQDKVREARAKYQSLGRLAWFNKEYEIVYDALSGELVWPQLDRDVHGIKPFTIPDDWARIRVIDPGYRNPCGVLWIAISPAGWRGCVDPETELKLPVMVVYREFYQKGLRVSEIVKAIKDRSGDERYSVDLIDPSSDIHKGNEVAGLSTMEQFVELGIKVLPASNAVAPGLDEVRRRLGVYGQSAALLLFDNLENTWKECLSYRYKEIGPVSLANQDAPETVRKKDDHLPDCVRYGCQWRPLPSKEGRAVVPFGTFAYVRKAEQKSKRGTWASRGW